MRAVQGDDICALPATRMRQLIKDRQLSSREVVGAHISRIERVDDVVNSVVTRVFDDALDTAKKIDSEEVGDRVLFGLPIAHKDLVPTAGIRTTYGSSLFAEHVPKEDHPLVRRLKRAGAVTIGKTNVPEFGAGSHTFNPVFGATRNPYHTGRTCGGSSGGAAAALATRMLPIADGSDTGGSLRNPGAFCNVVGFRPTQGVLGPPMMPSQSWNSISTYGPMGRTVDDTHLLFSAMLEKPYLPLPEIDLRGVRVAFSPNWGVLPVEASIQTQLRRFAASLESAGAHVSETSFDFEDARRIFHITRAMGFSGRFNQLSPDEFATLKEPIQWNVKAGNLLVSEDLAWAREARLRFLERFAAFFRQFDILLGPVTQVLPFPVEWDWVHSIDGHEMETYIEWMEACSWITVTRCPSLSLPAGFVDNLPVGAQLVAKQNHDEFLLRVARAAEQLDTFWTREPSISAD